MGKPKHEGLGKSISVLLDCDFICAKCGYHMMGQMPVKLVKCINDRCENHNIELNVPILKLERVE